MSTIYKKQSREDVESQEIPGGYGDPRSSLPPPPPLHPTNVDRVLYEYLVDAVSLVQSLIDPKPNKSFTRRSPVIYTKTPSRDLSKKNVDAKGGSAAKSLPRKKQGDFTEKDQSEDPRNDGNHVDNSFVFNLSEKEMQGLTAVKQQVEDLQKELSKKDELLKAAENSKNQMSLLQANYDHLRRYAAEKDSLIKSIQHDLSNAKMKLADKQAALETTQWEAMTSNQKVEKLQDEIVSLQSKMSSFVLLVEGLTEDDPAVNRGDYEVIPYYMDPVPGIDDMDENEMLEMEEARKIYLAAVAAAKERKDEDSLKAAVNARLYLQSFLFKANSN